MIKRILLTLLLAWLAVAPAIAGSCVAGCETRGAASTHHVVDQDGGGAQSHRDCHGLTNLGSTDSGSTDAGSTGGDDSQTPQEGWSMAVACFVASAASVPCSYTPLVSIDVGPGPESLVLLPPISFETSPPNKPPQT